MAKKSVSKALKDFWYGKPHTAAEGGRRLGELHEDKTHLYKHREWRGVKDTMYYFYNIWLYNYIFMVKDIMVMHGPITFAKGLWRYRWVGQTYLPVLHWFDRGLEGMRGEAMKASAWHYRAMVSTTIRQFRSPPIPVCTAASRTTCTSTPSPTTRPSGAACSIPGTVRSPMSRWK